jgi:pimeloyl-ACP methyl ester carboxylesterase
MRVRGFTLSLCLLALWGCGNTSPSTPPSSPLLNLVSGTIPGASGGGLSLPNGDSVTFPAGSLQGSAHVTLSSNETETPASPATQWASAPGTMTLTFGAALTGPRGGSQSAPVVTLKFVYAKANATAILKAQAPVLAVTTSDGKTQTLSADATFDASSNTATVTVLAQLLNNATAVKLYVAMDGSGSGSGQKTYPFGPKYWNATAGQWQPEPFTVNPSQRTVVMVHGIFSAVETAFPCEQAIINAGKYGQAVGLDYDWTQPPATEAPILAKFVNALPVSTVDLEAHSYGTVVALAALPLIKKTIGHVVLLGGPLPLNGAPQADPGYLRDLLIAGVWIAAPSQVEAAVKSGMIGAMASNSKALQAIESGLKPMTLPPFVQVAGGSPFPQETQNALIYAFYLYLYGGATNDGIVEQKSALETFATKQSTITFINDDHVELECDPNVQNWVGPLVAPSS